MNFSLIRHFNTPWMIFLGAALGIFIGLYEKELASMIAPVGNIYLTLLQLCVLPILVSAVVVCIYRLLSSDQISEYLSRMGIVFAIGFLLMASVGTILTISASPGGDMDAKTKTALGQLLIESADTSTLLTNTAYEEVYLHSDDTREASRSMVDFILDIFPNNIFNSLVDANSIQVLLFSIILGIALGTMQLQKAEAAVNFFDSIFDAFTKIVNGLMYLLPFGLCALLAKQVSMIGSEFLFAVLGLLIVIIGASFTLIVVGLTIVYVRSGTSFFKSVKAQKDPLFIAFATTNSLATIPSAIASLTKEMRFASAQVNLIIPIGITIARFGTILVFAIIALYMAQLYEIELGWSQIAFIVFGSILAGIATAGAPGEIAASMVAIVLAPLGLPVETAITILLLTNPLTDPFLTTLNVQGNIAATSFIANKQDSDAIA